MSYFLVQASYSAATWAALIKNPSDPKTRLQGVAEMLGGRIVDVWFSFGEYDVVGIAEFPDKESAAAFSITAIAGGAGGQLKTTPLLSIEEGLATMEKAAALPYRRPGE